MCAVRVVQPRETPTKNALERPRHRITVAAAGLSVGLELSRGRSGDGNHSGGAQAEEAARSPQHEALEELAYDPLLLRLQVAQRCALHRGEVGLFTGFPHDLQ